MPVQLSDFQSKRRNSLGEITIGSFSIEIGLGLSIFGVGFIFIGMIFLFDKGLLALGNVSDVHRLNLFDECCSWGI